MIYSMTGFGQASGTYNGKNIKFEIKTLNGRSTDLRIKVPAIYKEKEVEVRNLILDGVQRGKIEATLSIDSEQGEEVYEINELLFVKYYEQLNKLAKKTNISDEHIMPSILRIPSVLVPQIEELSEDEWNILREIVNKTIVSLNEFRSIEGAAMSDDFVKNIESIRSNLAKVDALEASRTERLRDRIRKNLQQFIQEENVDQNRYEQEILYYLEKLDINEEKMRLAQHCNYFIEVLNSPETKVKGKKLSFISQEIGREINTMGSKAQEHKIQQIVVEMKDDLEKIKEMVANVL